MYVVDDGNQQFVGEGNEYVLLSLSSGQTRFFFDDCERRIGNFLLSHGYGYGSLKRCVLLAERLKTVESLQCISIDTPILSERSIFRQESENRVRVSDVQGLTNVPTR